MKTNLFLITKYWRYHKKQFASMLTSIVILTAFLLIALLMERTECRRQYDDKLREVVRHFTCIAILAVMHMRRCHKTKGSA